MSRCTCGESPACHACQFARPRTTSSELQPWHQAVPGVRLRDPERCAAWVLDPAGTFTGQLKACGRKRCTEHGTQAEAAAA